ncbi:hypothetical protein B0J14DRAFT_637259 [Halenospora varia]|nr:hypothetical protein B0J14DRAFT_637259 [Halenospora varia]
MAYKPLYASGFHLGDFKVWNLGKDGDKKTNVTGTATYSGAIDFLCYDCHHNTILKVLTREPSSGKDDRILAEIKKASHKLEDAVKNNVADAKGYQIWNSNYNLYFDILEGEALGDAFYDPDPPILEKDHKVTNYKMSWVGPAEATCDRKIPWPAEIMFQVQIASQALQDWVDQDTVIIRVAKGPVKEDGSYKKVEAFAKSLSGAFGAMGVLTGGVASAIEGASEVFLVMLGLDIARSRRTRRGVEVCMEIFTDGWTSIEVV